MKTLLRRFRRPTPPLQSVFQAAPAGAVAAFAIVLFASSSNILAASAEQENHWPAWRGPLGTGVAPKAAPPLRWSETSNIKWKVKLPGSGSSTPVIWRDQIFIQTALSTGKKPDASATAAAGPGPEAGRGRGPGGGRGSVPPPDEIHQFVLLSVDRNTGKILWQKTAREELPHEGHHRDHGFASHSPVTDGEHVIAYFGSRGLYCYDLQGDLKWSKDLGRMRTRNNFGEGSSPALHGSTVVVNWDHEGDDFIVALDKATGQEKWRQQRDEITTWATPLILEHEGKAQVIASGTRKIRSYDLETGKLIWEHAGLTDNVIPSPVAGDGVVYVMSGFRGNQLYAIRLGRTGDLTGTDALAWSYPKQTPYVPSPLLYRNHLYFFSHNNAMLSVLNAKTGEPLVDAERIEGMQGVYASPVGADGRVYLTGRNGVSVVLRHSDKLEVLASNRLDDSFDASPALVGKDLFLRGNEFLYCISEQ